MSPSKAPFKNKVALVTGGGQGIGLAIAKALADEGCRVVISGRNVETLRKAAAKSPRITAMTCDVREPADIKVLLSQIRKKFGQLDILINNAGIAVAGQNVADMSLDAWRSVIDTNLTGTFLVTQAALGLMESGGVIVNNLSIAAKRVWPGWSAYCASKHGALGFTNTLREELRSREIRVIALLPGATDTDIWDSFGPDVTRKKMMSASTVARAVMNAIALPDDSTLEELTILPRAGTL